MVRGGNGAESLGPPFTVDLRWSRSHVFNALEGFLIAEPLISRHSGRGRAGEAAQGPAVQECLERRIAEDGEGRGGFWLTVTSYVSTLVTSLQF